MELQDQPGTEKPANQVKTAVKEDIPELIYQNHQIQDHQDHWVVRVSKDHVDHTVNEEKPAHRVKKDRKEKKEKWDQEDHQERMDVMV